MADNIDQIVAKAVTKVLEQHFPRLREELIQRVADEVKPAMGSGALSGGASAEELLRSVASVQAGTTQKEILRALLEASAGFAGRSALFVVKAGAATGWQGRGFANSDDIKDFALDVSGGVAFEALNSRVAAKGRGEEVDPKFSGQFGLPEDDRVIVLPLMLKDKVAALVYADAGGAGGIDASALELLVTVTSGWLEVVSSRKQAPKEPSVDAVEAAPVPVQTVSTFADPFASHAPKHIAAAAGAGATEQQTVHATEAPAPKPQISPEDAEVHRKAQRFARLLMDEIKLYNQAKVSEGRKNRDLYDRLKDDIEKSRDTYKKRYGNTVAADADYFSVELLRSLAEDDVSVMGPNFHR